MPTRPAPRRSADAYAWPAVLGLAVVVRLGVLAALPELFDWRVTLPIVAVHVACDLVTMILVRRIAITAVDSAPIGTLAAAAFALHPHLVFETLSHRDTSVVLLAMQALVWLVVRWFAGARRLGPAAALVAAVSGAAVGVWVATAPPHEASGRAISAAPPAPRVEPGELPATTAPAPPDPVLDYGRLLNQIYRGVAVLLALVGAVQLRSRAAVVLLVIPPLVCTGAGFFGRADLDPARAPLLGEPLLLVLAAAGLAVLARWWSPPRPAWRPVESPDHGLEWPPSSD